MSLTPPQNKILEYLLSYQARSQPMPSIQEITDYCQYASTRATRDHLAALERGGCISRVRGKARSLRVLCDSSKESRVDDIPVLGSIPAGGAEAQSESVEGMLHFDLSSLGLRNSSGLFALRVRGNSMTARGIYEGDVAIIDPAATPSDGDAVAALVDEEVTLKTLVWDGMNSYLKAENAAFDDIFPLQALEIQGVVKAIIRIRP